MYRPFCMLWQQGSRGLGARAGQTGSRPEVIFLEKSPFPYGALKFWRKNKKGDD